MCGTGYPAYPIFLPPTLNIFLRILKLEENSRTKLFCSAILFQLQNLEKNTYQNDHLKQNSKLLCIQSLVLEVKGLKRGYIFKNKLFYMYISFVFEIFNTFPSTSKYSKKTSFPKKVSYLPTLIFSGCSLNHTSFFIWPKTLWGAGSTQYLIFLFPNQKIQEFYRVRTGLKST